MEGVIVWSRLARDNALAQQLVLAVFAPSTTSKVSSLNDDVERALINSVKRGSAHGRRETQNGL